MECRRCKGLMVKERFSDYLRMVYAWKCLNCGAIIDPTINHNRLKNRAEDSQVSITT
jgi:hypothetical protein